MENETYIGEVIDLTHDGAGVVKLDKLAVFIDGCILGDIVEFRIIEMKKSFAIGELIQIKEYSQMRANYSFDTKTLGGGVPLIELEYGHQLQWKRDKVKKDFKKIAGLDIEVEPVLGMAYPFRYRNHTQVPVGSLNGKTITGYYRKGTNEIIPMTEDFLQPEIGSKILSVVREWMDENSIAAYDRDNKSGAIKHIGIRVNQNNEAMVIVVTSFAKIPELYSLAHKLVREAPGIISIYQNINTRDNGPTYSNQYIHIFGDKKMTDYIGDLRFEISPDSFFQVNSKQVEVLYNTAIKFLDLKKEDIVADIYCGVGTISLLAAKTAKRVYGIEYLESAVKNAKKNAQANEVSNAEFIAGKAEATLAELFEKSKDINKVILDPPRKGCEPEVINRLILQQPEKIVYVSCNPATLARDVKMLVDGGYKVEAVQPVDMFPHTSHVECVVLMS
ncbi:MAG: 23S rRNA (uracil(1939)-C(5))-methyltransferase RlmD, partial [Gudongella sp.]|nr:23S rRNA (uracil(1939)-C(5))-methyltransferase RlmD [Gudongella sp.]